MRFPSRPWITTPLLLLVLQTQASGQQPTLELWLDASDLTTIETDGIGVTAWRDKSSNDADMLRTADAPTLLTDQQNGMPGIELLETDVLKTGAHFANADEAHAVIMVCRPLLRAGRIFAYGSLNLSLLRIGALEDDRLGLQTNNNCLTNLPNAGINGTSARIYAVRREPSGTGQDVTFWRHDGGVETDFHTCAHLSIDLFELSNGGVNFPPSPEAGQIVFEVRAYTAPVLAASGGGPAISDAFLLGEMQALEDKWDPAPLSIDDTTESVTWGQLKSLYR